MNDALTWTIGIILWIAVIPLIALVFQYVGKKLRLKNATYKTALIGVAIMSVLNYFILFATYILISQNVFRIVLTLLLQAIVWYVTISKSYKLNAKQTLIFIGWYAVCAIIISLVVIAVGAVFIFTFNKSSPTPLVPNIVALTCSDKCLSFPDHLSSEIVVANKTYYCYCKSQNGDRTKQLELPVDFDWDGLEKNISII